MVDETVSLEFLARLSQQTLEELRALRKEVADVRTLSLQTAEYVRRVEQRVNDLDRRITEVGRRVSEQRDDLELMIKIEIGGAMANMQTQFEHYLRPIHDKLFEIDELEKRVRALETR